MITPESPGVDGPVLSAIVFGYRNEETILRSVRSLVEQESVDRFEVVVATSGGDRSAELVRDHFPAVQVAESEARLMPGGVRNLGLRMVRGDFIAFLEADCLACRDWISKRIALHRAGHAAVACGMSVTPADGRAGRAALFLTHPNRIVGHRAGPADRYQIYGLSLTRQALERAGPFDETIRNDEDTEMAELLESLGFDIWFEPSVVREHIGPSTRRALTEDQYRRGVLDSWREILTMPPGPHRAMWESRRGLRAPVIALRTARKAARRLRFTRRELSRGGVSQRELLSLSTLLAAGELAYDFGWCADQLRHMRVGAGDSPRGILPMASGIRRRVATDGRRLVALTFDDAPTPDTAATLGLLERLGVRASFFVTGAAAQARPDDVRAIAADGHAVAIAGWSGRRFTELSDDDLDRELSDTQALVADLTGVPVRHARPPHGDYDRRVVARLEARDLAIWLWSTHPRSMRPTTGPADAARVFIEGLTPGSLLVLPHGGDIPAESLSSGLSALVDEARRLDYTFVTVTAATEGDLGSAATS